MLMSWLTRFGYHKEGFGEIADGYVNDDFIVIEFQSYITIDRRKYSAIPHKENERFYLLKYSDREFMVRVCDILDLR